MHCADSPPLLSCQTSVRCSASRWWSVYGPSMWSTVRVLIPTLRGICYPYIDTRLSPPSSATAWCLSRRPLNTFSLEARTSYTADSPPLLSCQTSFRCSASRWWSVYGPSMWSTVRALIRTLHSAEFAIHTALRTCLCGLEETPSISHRRQGLRVLGKRLGVRLVDVTAPQWTAKSNIVVRVENVVLVIAPLYPEARGIKISRPH